MHGVAEEVCTVQSLLKWLILITELFDAIGLGSELADNANLPL